GGGRSAGGGWGAGAPVRPAQDGAGAALGGPLAPHGGGRSPLGAPPWRFWASGPRFSHRHPPLLTLRRASDRAQRAPRSQVVVPGGRGPRAPEANGYKPRTAGRHPPPRANFSQAIETDNAFGGRARPSTLPSTLAFGQTGR